MGKITGFLEFEREDRDYQPVEQRVKHWREFVLPLPEDEITKQAARCRTYRPHPEEARAAGRLEGWPQVRCLWPSFETRPAGAPQDEDRASEA